MRPLALLLALILAGFACAVAHAQPACGSEPERRVSLSSQPEPADAPLITLVERHLAASLAARGIALCTGSRPLPALAHLSILLTRSESGAAQVTIRVGDAVTQKRSERSMDLSQLPDDSRPLAIASSADELLRASWAELAMHDAPPSVSSAPSAVLRAVESSVRPLPIVRRDELGLELSAMRLRNRAGLGGRLRYAHYFGARWGLLFGAGSSVGLPERARHGSVRADILEVELGASYALTPIGARLGVALDASLAAARVSFVASANAAGEASSFQDWAASSYLRARGWWGAGALRATLSLGLSYGLRATRASDEGRTVVSTRGPGGELLLGLCAFL